VEKRGIIEPEIMAELSPDEKNYIPVPIKKRVSPADYRDGFVAGLRCAELAVHKAIESYVKTRELLEASDPEQSAPSNPDN
jgi:hypothetical protein